LSASSSPVWSSLRTAASAFCPPLELSEEHPADLRVALRDPASGAELTIRYRSERGLFLRTYFLVAEAEIGGRGPVQPAELAWRRGKLRWTRPKPPDAELWQEGFGSAELRNALRGLQIERLSLTWEPARATWRFSLETLAGAVVVTFFPPLATPNPLKHTEAEALTKALNALRSARTQA
jgi:hypothetical protein